MLISKISNFEDKNAISDGCSTVVLYISGYIRLDWIGWSPGGVRYRAATKTA